MPKPNITLKKIDEGEQQPLVSAPDATMQSGAKSPEIRFMETQIEVDVALALENLNTEEEGKTEKQRIYQRYCPYISYISKEVMDKVNSLPQKLYEKEIKRQRQRQWLVNNGQVSENHYDFGGITKEELEKLKNFLNSI